MSKNKKVKYRISGTFTKTLTKKNAFRLICQLLYMIFFESEINFNVTFNDIEADITKAYKRVDQTEYFKNRQN